MDAGGQRRRPARWATHDGPRRLDARPGRPGTARDVDVQVLRRRGGRSGDRPGRADVRRVGAGARRGAGAALPGRAGVPHLRRAVGGASHGGRARDAATEGGGGEAAMNEVDWLSGTEPASMLDHAESKAWATERKLRLFACACV